VEKTHSAGNGRSFTAEGEQKLLEDQAELLESRYPEWDWKVIEVERHVFNFVGTKKKEAA